MKIAVIGGGSSYTPELMEGLIGRAKALELKEVWLHDIAEERLEVVAGFCARMAKAAGSKLSIRPTLDLAEAVKGARFVIAQIRVGGNAARREDELLGARHGLIGQETTGVGGFAKALRTVPAMLDICKVIERESPRAFLVNFTNPSGLVTEAVLKHSKVRAIGLCNIPITFHLELAKALGLPREKVALDYVGLNHLSWVRGVLANGKDVTEKVMAWAGAAGRPASLEELDYPPEFIRALGMIPMHYLRYYYLTARMIAEQKKMPRTRAEEVMEIEQRLMEIYRDPTADRKPELLGQRGGAHYSLAALELIEGIKSDRGDVQVLNVENQGAVPGLDDDAVVEVPCRVGKHGAATELTEEPGPEIMGLIRTVKAYETLTIQAAVERDYNKALLALAVHPLGPDADHVKPVLDDVIATHGINLE
ncbi:MAG TPA: 6-phospho-beta-glucosidase [bacterium]|nr:6-phospho-beta-glucosidase [bacterium]